MLRDYSSPLFYIEMGKNNVGIVIPGEDEEKVSPMVGIIVGNVNGTYYTFNNNNGKLTPSTMSLHGGGYGISVIGFPYHKEYHNNFNGTFQVMETSFGWEDKKFTPRKVEKKESAEIVANDWTFAMEALHKAQSMAACPKWLKNATIVPITRKPKARGQE